MAMTTPPSFRTPVQFLERFLSLDFAVLGLAVASLVLLVAEANVDFHPEESFWLKWIDYMAIAIFGLLLVGKAFASGNPLEYMKTHWFDVFGLLPITQPFFGLDRFWVIVGAFIVLARFSAALDRAFGERVLWRILERYRNMLVEELTEPILRRILILVREALEKGRYMDSVGRTVEEKREDIHEIVRKSIAASPKLTFVNGLPGVNRKINEAVDEAVTSAVVALTSEELNALVTDAISQALRDLEIEMQKPSWKTKGMGVSELAKGMGRFGSR